MLGLILTKAGILNSYFEKILDERFHIKSVATESLFHLIDLIKGGYRPDILIIELPESQLADLHPVLEKFKIKIPLLLFATKDELDLHASSIPYHPLISTIDIATGANTVGNAIARLLRIKKRQEHDNQRYYQVSSDHFMQSGHTAYDLYIRIGQEKHLKIFSQGDQIESYELDRLTEGGERELYLKENDYAHFTQHLLGMASNNIDQKSTDMGHATALAVFAQKTLNSTLHQIGINESTVETANDCIEIVSKLVEKNGTLSDFLSKCLHQDDFSSRHSVVTAYVAVAMLSYTPFSSQSTHLKMTLAAMFHDIALEDEELIKIPSNEDKTFNKLSSHRKKIYLQHPQLAVDILNKIDGLPPDVETIILQHHEHPDGHGFPRSLAFNRIHALSAFFIIAEDFTHSIITSGIATENIICILQNMKIKYHHENFKIGMTALIQALGRREMQKSQNEVKNVS